MDAKTVIDWFNMMENKDEGGYFAGTHTSSILLDNKELPGFKPIKNKRPICSAIYYLLQQGGFSTMHSTTGDMLYHFYNGDPVQMLLLYPPGSPNQFEVSTFSNDIVAGGSAMKVIPGGTWLGSRLVANGNYALMGVTMAPGFDPADYAIAKRKDLIKQYPLQQQLITELTRN